MNDEFELAKSMCSQVGVNFDLGQLRLLVTMMGIEYIDDIPIKKATKEQLCRTITQELEENRLARTYGKDEEDKEGGFKQEQEEQGNDEEYQFEEQENGDDEEYQFEEQGNDEEYQFEEQGNDEEYQFEEQGDNEYQEEEIEKGGMVPYKVLSMTDIQKMQDKAVEKVVGVIGNVVNNSKIRLLLRYFNWDPEAVIAAWSEDSDVCCRKVGIRSPFSETGIPSKGVSPFCELDIPKKTICHRIEEVDKSKIDAIEIEETCNICYEDYRLKDFFKSGECDHKFCPDCWKSYIDSNLGDKKTMKCPKRNCDAALEEDTVKFILSETPDLKKRYERTLAESIVGPNTGIKWCPGPNCDKAIQLLSKKRVGDVVKCDCDTSWCFGCGREDHLPSTCMMSVEWDKEQDQMTHGLIASISKPCPNCFTGVEKHSGCNRMVCVCGFMFCWNCNLKFGSGPMGSTDGYITHQCNQSVYDTGIEVKNLKDDALVKKQEYEKFKWYAERIMNHERSFKLESLLYGFVKKHERKIVEKFGMDSLNYVYKAIDRLLLNRRLLINSYIFGYYRTKYGKNVNKDIFENIQNELERYTEQLSDLLPFSSWDAMDENKTSTDLSYSPNLYVVNVRQATIIAKRVYDALIDVSSDW